MKTHQPSRICPHRFCGPLHVSAGIGGLAFVAAAAVDRPMLLLVMLVGALASAAIYRLVHRQTMTDSVREAADGHVRYEVRPAWARAAAAVDAVLAAAIVGSFVYSCLSWQSDAGDDAVSRTSLALALLAGVAVTVVDEMLHRKAIRIAGTP